MASSPKETTKKDLNLTRIRFPEIQLQTRDAHKLRGYFGNLFKEYSPVLHNHYEDGSLRYKYPLVQYKVIHHVPMLIGINEGAELLPQLFLKIKSIDIDGQSFPVHSKNIEHEMVEAGFSNDLHTYKFETLWMALNQENYAGYRELDEKNQRVILNKILVGHILGFFRNIGLELQAHEHLMAKVDVREKSTNFKENKMIAFSGGFVVNALLPGGIGLGKSTARGFGTIMKCK